MREIEVGGGRQEEEEEEEKCQQLTYSRNLIQMLLQGDKNREQIRKTEGNRMRME